MINRFQPPSVEHYGHFFMPSTKDAFLLKKIAVQSIVLVMKRTLKLSLTLTLHWQEQERCSSKVIVSLRSLPRATSTTITSKISNALGFVYEIVTGCPAVLKRLLSKSSASLRGLLLFFPHLSLQDFFLQRLASKKRVGAAAATSWIKNCHPRGKKIACVLARPIIISRVVWCFLIIALHYKGSRSYQRLMPVLPQSN